MAIIYAKNLRDLSVIPAGSRVIFRAGWWRIIPRGAK